MFKETLFPPSPTTLTAICGPPGMNDAAVALCEKLGYKKEARFLF
jgi:NAD(P)H-flavin reductase